jgi:hypothetical protein
VALTSLRPWRHAGLLNTKISYLPEESQTLINYLSKVPNEPLSKKGDCVRLGESTRKRGPESRTDAGDDRNRFVRFCIHSRSLVCEG